MSSTNNVVSVIVLAINFPIHRLKMGSEWPEVGWSVIDLNTKNKISKTLNEM